MEYFIELLKYIILGIIQGITEIFPVSSSGHLVIFSHLFMGGQDLDSSLMLFLMITNMGSFLALVVFYFKDIKCLVGDSWSYVFNPLTRNNRETKSSFLYALKLIIAVIPLGIAGLLFKEIFTKDLLTVGISLIVTSLLLFTVFMYRNAEFTQELTFKNAAVIGLFQAFAVLPGLSRSGITMVGGLSQRVRLQHVLRFSFLSYILISIPVSALGLFDAIKNPGIIDIPGFILAFIFSFIFSLLTIRTLKRFVTVKNLIYFSIYTLLMGSLSIILNFI